MNPIIMSIGWGQVERGVDFNDGYDIGAYEVANYFSNIDFATQVALHQELYRKPLKFKCENEKGAVDKLIFTKSDIIYLVKSLKLYGAQSIMGLTFCDKNICERAIKPYIEDTPRLVNFCLYCGQALNWGDCVIISIFLAAIGIGIVFWCEPYLEGANRIIFGIFLFLGVSAAVITAVIQERNVKKRIESLEQKAIKTYEWANCVTNILSPMADSVQTHDRILKEICNEVRENDK